METKKLSKDNEEVIEKANTINGMEAVKKEDEKETTKDKNGIATILAIILIEKNIFVDFLEVIVYTF